MSEYHSNQGLVSMKLDLILFTPLEVNLLSAKYGIIPYNSHHLADCLTVHAHSVKLLFYTDQDYSND